MLDVPAPLFLDGRFILDRAFCQAQNAEALTSWENARVGGPGVAYGLPFPGGRGSGLVVSADQVRRHDANEFA